MTKPPINSIKRTPGKSRKFRIEHFPHTLRDYITQLGHEDVPVQSHFVPYPNESIKFVALKYLKTARECGDPVYSEPARLVTQLYVLRWRPPTNGEKMGALEFYPRQDTDLGLAFQGALEQMEIEHGVGLANAVARQEEQTVEPPIPETDTNPLYYSGPGNERAGAPERAGNERINPLTPAGWDMIGTDQAEVKSLSQPLAQASEASADSPSPGSLPAPARPLPQAPDAHSIYGVPAPAPSPPPAIASHLDRLTDDYRAIRALSGPTVARVHIEDECYRLGLSANEVAVVIARASPPADER